MKDHLTLRQARRIVEARARAVAALPVANQSGAKYAERVEAIEGLRDALAALDRVRGET